MRNRNICRLGMLPGLFAGVLACSGESDSVTAPTAGAASDLTAGSSGAPAGVAGAATGMAGAAGTTGSTAGTNGATGGAGAPVATAGAAGAATAGAGATGGAGAPVSAAGAAGSSTAGTPATAGAAGSGSAGTGGDPVSTACAITFDSVDISAKIPTVGIVEWSTDLAGLTEAHIEFGLDTTYGFTAPVDTAEPGNRTLLLGMKAQSTYNFRVVATGTGGTCMSENQTITTGTLDTSLPDLTVTTPGTSAGGFIVTGTYQGGPAYILDADRDFVWWYPISEVTRAHMSYDGKHMWMTRGNVPNSNALVLRVSMDGLEEDNLSQEFTGLNHDLTPAEDGAIIFFAYGQSSSGANCDDVKEWKDGNVRTIVNAGDAHGVAGNCHLNSIHIDRTDNTIVFSDLDHNNYTKVNRETGETVWVLGGTSSDFTGDGASWNAQHGFHLLPDNHILLFNNRGYQGGGSSSLALEMALDLGAMTSTRVWEYASSPGINNQIMGDVQRLDNGNTLVTYSTQGIAHEVDANKTLVQSISWGLGGAVGYANLRHSLYGPPPK